MKIYKYAIAIVSLLSLMACEETSSKFGTTSDIVFPNPQITDVTPNPEVGDTITVTGVNFVAPNSATIDGIGMMVVSETATELKVVLPRVFNQARIIIKNSYNSFSEGPFEIKPIYPTESEITVTAWPIEIVRGRPLVIRGTNIDMVIQVVIGNNTIEVNPLVQQRDRLQIQVPSTVSESESTILLKTIINTTIESPVLSIIDYDPINWIPIAPITVLNYEDLNKYWISGGSPTPLTAQIDRAGIAPAPANIGGRTISGGSHFFSLYGNPVSGAWDYLGSTVINTKIDLSSFHDPYLTFLLNSSDAIGNFQVAIVQGPQKLGGDFQSTNTGNKLDNYCLRPTNREWQWVSVSLNKLMTSNWGGPGSPFDPIGEINSIEFVYKQGSGNQWNGLFEGDIYSGSSNKVFKINIDNVMITDGVYPKP